MCICRKCGLDNSTPIVCMDLIAPLTVTGSIHPNSFWIHTPSPLPDLYDGAMHSLAIQSDTRTLTYLWMSVIVPRDSLNAWSSIQPSVGDMMSRRGFPGTKR